MGVSGFPFLLASSVNLPPLPHPQAASTNPHLVLESFATHHATAPAAAAAAPPPVVDLSCVCVPCHLSSLPLDCPSSDTLLRDVNSFPSEKFILPARYIFYRASPLSSRCDGSDTSL
ncbi:hypothetical protein EX30DRAFT_232955 [Ascodesmis nigricans]|uniref:Uncharacterized protein n=1 Tax=Ascodesmis nigricans TaxID=341454 RepID=A0A4S2MYI5_9PEZI|nr:hypothetical protein EX30DRAFT_232955 [Ascodesmis nigricans]